MKKFFGNILVRRVLLSLAAFLLVVVAFTVYANVKVEKLAEGRIYTNVEEIPYNKVALLLGTNPLNRYGRPNSYFTLRIQTAVDLYNVGKIDYIIASGDNHTKKYDEPTAMCDSLMAHGIPEDRIILDYAGFRTLDSVVRAKEVFGCDSITIISQADHNARALYLAEANGIEAVAMTAPLRAGRRVRIRLALREWLARDKMMLDIWFGKKPHFLGEKIQIPDVMPQKSYSTIGGMTMKIVSPSIIKAPVDSLVVEFINVRDIEGMTGEMFEIEKKDTDGKWKELSYKPTKEGEVAVVFPAIGYPVAPKATRRITVKPWFYEQNWTPGTYRLSKTFHYRPYLEKSDTAYVEFQIR